MAFRIFQFSIVFTIVFIIFIVKVSATVVDGAGVTLGELPEASLEISNPQDVILSRGSRNSALRCRARSSQAGGKPHITWEGSIANNTPHIEMRDDLLIFNKPLKPSYAGEYRCLVKNKDGQLLSSTAKVQIAALSRTFIEEPQNTTVELGQPAHFKCQIQSTPNAKITWEKDRKPIALNSRFIILNSGDLFITVVKANDEGSYRCSAENKLIKNKNVRKSSEGKLIVTPVQKIDRDPSFLPIYKNSYNYSTNFTAKFGENLLLICAVEGWPIPRIKWTRKGENVSLGNSSILHLRNLNLDNNDSYECTAKNSMGQIKQVFNVEVVQAPYFNKTPSSYWFWSARTVRLECIAHGIPTPEITWLKDGKPLTLNGRIKRSGNFLVLSHTFTADSGFYQCVAKNKVGETWTAAQLIARSNNLPKAPSNLRCRPFNDRSVCLQWDPPLNDTVKAYSIYAYGVNAREYVTNDTYKLADNLDPNTNYSFYVRAYTGEASDKSENIICQTVVSNNRKMSFKAISSNILLIEWNELSNDVPCGGTVEYKLQWRRAGHPSNNAEIVKTNSFIIRGLLPSTNYEVRIQTINSDENIPWSNFTMPDTDDDMINSIQGAVNDSELKQTQNQNKTILAPVHLEATPLSTKSIVLSWKDPDQTLKSFYRICFSEVNKNQKSNCDEHANFIESSTTKKEIKGLKPFTKYEFRVRLENLDGSHGPYSLAVEYRTPEDVPSPVTDLKWKRENSTTACLKWRKPNHFNGELKHYLVSYSSNQTLELEQWPTLILPAQKANKPGCWGYSHDTISTFLGPLVKGHSYFVVVRAATKAGLSKPTEAVKLNTFIKNIPIDTKNSENYYGLQDDQKLGIIIGTIISLFCIIGCISCMVFRRRCIKSRGLERVRAVANPTQTTNGQTVHQTQNVSTVPNLPVVQQIRQCNDAEIHELQCLVNHDIVTSHIPPLPHSNLDTKGGTLYPNGQINGLKYYPLSNGNIPNGNVHITENPQYEPYECNGHFNSTSESRQLLSGEVERSGNSEDTLNSTQLTSLDETLTISTHRTVSPILGPNG